MTETAALIIKVDSSGAKTATGHLKDLERAAGSNERQAHKLGKAWGVATGLISSAAIIGATTGYLKLADTWALMNARLGMVTKSSGELKQVQGELFKLAQESRTSLEGVTDLYVKLANSSDALRNNQSLLIGVTTNVSKALTLSGADAASATAVIRQFSQAMATGTLRGDEFVSVMEGAPRLARAIADGLKVPVGALREMAAQGKLTSDVVIQALESQGQVIDREFRNMPLTVSGAVERVQNSLLKLIGKTEETSGATSNLATAISDMADVLGSEETAQAFATVATAMGGLITLSVKLIAAFNDVGKSLGNALAGAHFEVESTLELTRLNKELAAAKQKRAGSLGLPSAEERAIQARIGAAQATYRRNKNMVAVDNPNTWQGKVGAAYENMSAGLPYLNPGRATALKPGQAGGWLLLPGADKPQESATGGSATPRATGGGRTPKASRGGASDSSAIREQQQAAREATAAYQEFQRSAEDVAAALRGPVAEANLQFDREMAALTESATKAGVSADALKAAQENLATQHAANVEKIKQEVEARNSQKTATQQLIEDMEFELSLIGKSNIEREKAIALRYADKDATAAQREQIAALAEDLAKTREAETYVNDIKSATTDFAAQALSDYKRAGDAAQDYAERLKQIAIRMLAEKAIQWLFSAFMGGGTGASSGGSAWSFGSNTYGNNNFGTGGTFGWGGGRATGGSVSRRSIYEVGEGGKPELLESDGRYYLLPGNDGRVSPAGRGGGSSAPPQVNVNIHNAPAGADVRQKKNPMGGIDIDVIFKQFEGRMASNVAGGSGPMGQAMKSRYNLREQV